MKASWQNLSKFQIAANKLAESGLIDSGYMNNNILKFTQDGEEQIIDLTPYITSYESLLHKVPSYKSDYTYVLYSVKDIDALCNYLKGIHNKSIASGDGNCSTVQTQLLSKMFGSDYSNYELFNHIYAKSFGEWMGQIFKDLDASKYNEPLAEGESMLMNHIRMMAEATYDALITNNSASADEIQLAGQSESADSEHHFDGLE